MAEILKLLWTFTSVRRRMILHEALVTRQTQTDSISSLEKLSRDAVMLSLISNNTQERLVNPLVDRMVLQAEAMNQDIKPVKDRLLTSLSGGSIIDQYG